MSDGSIFKAVCESLTSDVLVGLPDGGIFLDGQKNVIDVIDALIKHAPADADVSYLETVKQGVVLTGFGPYSRDEKGVLRLPETVE